MDGVEWLLELTYKIHLKIAIPVSWLIRVEFSNESIS